MMARIIAGVVFGLNAGMALASGPATAPVGSPCFCAQACQARGITYSNWTDPAGARVDMANCPPADPGQLGQNAGLCSCASPLDWYRLWNELNAQKPATVSPNH